jgi:hypothetical protein
MRPEMRPEEAGRVTDPPLRIFRCLKKTAIVLMLLFRLDKPVGESEIAEILDLHPETTRIYLRSLAGLGLVTRTHRYHGWMLTTGGRQMILGESDNGWDALEAGKIKTSAENPRSIPESSTASAENPRSIMGGATASAEIPRSRPIAAASLSFKAESNKAAAAIAKARAEVPTAKVKVLRSLVSRGFQLSKRRERDTRARPRSDPVVRANLEVFGSIGVTSNDFVLEICKMDHVTPDYILGQAKRLEAERRYSPGLLLTVIRSRDHLPEKYLPRQDPDLHALDTELPPEDEPDPIPAIHPDSSIHQPMFTNGMTAAKAWSAALCQLKIDTPKVACDKWVSCSVLLSARDGAFTIGAPDAFARNWLESRLSSTVTRFLTGVCNRPVGVRFVEIKETG